MISNKLAQEKNTLTTHHLSGLKVARAIKAIPEEHRAPEEKQFLADFEQEVKGIMTISDVHEAITAKKEAAEQPVPAPDHGIVEIEKKAPVKHSVNKKPAIVKVKHGKKKNA